MENQKEDSGKKVFSELPRKELQEFIDAQMKILSALRELIPTVCRILNIESQAQDSSQREDLAGEDRNPVELFQMEIQKRFISLGEALEQTYGLQDTEILRHLERCCEETYQIGNAAGTELEELGETLDRHIQEIPERAMQSIEVRPRKLSVTSILGRESPYVQEWVEYHLLAGVEHFYIYDNQKDEALPVVLAPYIEEGIVTLLPMPGECVMFTAYNDALDRFRFETDYMAFIDGDEFLVPLQEGKKIPDMIDAIFERYNRERYPWHGQEAGGIGVNWRVYGMNGHEKKPEGLVIENYLYRAEDTLPYSTHVKVICNPRVVEAMYTPHRARYKPGYWSISERGSLIFTSVFHDAHFEYLQCNHYAFKSKEEFWDRRGRKEWPDLKKGFFYEGSAEKYFEWTLRDERECNAVYDPVLLPYAPLIKARLNSRTRGGESVR